MENKEIFEVQKVSTPEELKIAFQIRRQVFVVEQGVAENLELDEYDLEATHFLVHINGKHLATGRMRAKDPFLKFERIATLAEARGRGAGRALMNYMQEFALNNFKKLVPYMHAQNSAIPFYEKLGWLCVGKEFLEADIPHHKMILPPLSPEAKKALGI